MITQRQSISKTSWHISLVWFHFSSWMGLVSQTELAVNPSDAPASLLDLPFPSSFQNLVRFDSLNKFLILWYRWWVSLCFPDWPYHTEQKGWNEGRAVLWMHLQSLNVIPPSWGRWWQGGFTYRDQEQRQNDWKIKAVGTKGWLAKRWLPERAWPFLIWDKKLRIWTVEDEDVGPDLILKELSTCFSYSLWKARK